MSGKENTAMNSTRPNLKQKAILALEKLLPAMNKVRNMKTYETFMQWRSNKNAKSFS